MNLEVANAIADAMSWQLTWAELHEASQLSGKPFSKTIYENSVFVGKAYFGDEHIRYMPESAHDLLAVFEMVLQEVRQYQLGVTVTLPIVNMLLLPGSPDAPRLVAIYKKKREARAAHWNGQHDLIRLGAIRSSTPFIEDESGRSRAIALD